MLVTGGGGSIGSEICRQIARCNPKKLVILDIYENNAYEIQMELHRTHPELNLTVLIGSVRNTNRVNHVVGKYKPDLIFHAAAHKHVPLMETVPEEAVKNNIFGTYTVGKYTVTALPANHDPAAKPVIYQISDGEKTMLYGNDTGFPFESVWEYWAKNPVRFDYVSLDCTGVTLQNYRNGHMCVDVNAVVRPSRFWMKSGN